MKVFIILILAALSAWAQPRFPIAPSGISSPNATATLGASGTVLDITHTFSAEATPRAVITCYTALGALITSWTRTDPDATTIRITFGSTQGIGTQCNANATGTGTVGPAGVSGESLTASNTGSLGVGVFKSKVSLDLQFYRIASANNLMTVALSGTDFLQMTINRANFNWLASEVAYTPGGSIGGATVAAAIAELEAEKQPILGFTPESQLTFSAPLLRNTNTISIPAASSTTHGHLLSTDWTTFNNKVSPGTSPSFVNVSITGGLIRTGTADGCATWLSGTLTTTAAPCGTGGGGGGEANITADVGGGVSIRGSTPKTGVTLNLRTFSATAPLAVAQSSDLITFSMPAASVGQSGYLTSADRATFLAKQDALGFTPINVTAIGAASGVAGLDSGSKVPVAQLPPFVSSVGLDLPNIFTVSNSPVTSTGTLTAVFASQAPNLALMTPISGTGTPSFRAMVAGDVPSLTASKIIDFNTQALAATASSYQSADNELTAIAIITPDDDNILLANGTTWEKKPIVNCANNATDKLLYTAATNTISCGTDQNTGEGGIGAAYWADKTSSTSWVVTAVDHNFGNTCDLAVFTYTEVTGVFTRAEPFSVVCDESTFDITISWATATAGRVGIHPGGGAGASTDAALKANNLSDLTSASTARANIGLGNVANYTVASQPEAEVGTAADRYMTPQRTSQAITARRLAASATFDVDPIFDGSCTSGLLISVTGAVAGEPVVLGLPASMPVGVLATAKVSATNTVEFWLCNITGTTLDPPSGAYTAQVNR
jgi:hypothetical protein